MGPFQTSKTARKHRYRYHSVPIQFLIGGLQYIIGQSDGKYTCPLPECKTMFKKREDMQSHITTDHNEDEKVKVFDTPDYRLTFIVVAPYHVIVHQNAIPDDISTVCSGAVLPDIVVHKASSAQDIGVRGSSINVESRTVSLLPSVDYLMSNEVLDSLGIPSATLQSFLDFCSESHIYDKPEHVKLPTPGGPPVQLIAGPSDGFACTASADCAYVVKDISTMQRHSREAHRNIGLIEIKYRSCQVQRIFTGVRNSYFEVSHNVAAGTRPDVKAILQATFLPAIDVALVVPADTERERTPLTRFMGWDKFKVDLRMNPAQRRAADEIKSKHTDDEHDGILVDLASTVREHMAKASTILDGHPHRLSLSKLLLYGDAIPRDNVLRDEDASPRTRMIVYHNLAWSLVDADPDLCVVDRWANPIKRAIWLRALRPDGNFCEASTLTPDLAKLKYFCNITSLLEALMDKEEDTDSVHFDDHDRVIRVHQRVLRLGRATTFNIVYEMQQYASSVSFNQTKEPNVYVDPDVKSITIGTETMFMDKLRDGIQRLLQDLKFRYLELTHDVVMLKVVPEQVKDDLTNSTRGYSLLSEEPFYRKRHDLLFHLVDEYDLAIVDNAGRLAWNIPAIKDLLRRSLRVWEPLYHLMYITTHISCRGTQFIDHKVSNADRHRNLFMQGNEMFLLTGYSKKTGITDRDSCTPGFVPKDIAFWVLEMLAGGLRTAEAILAGVAYGTQSEHIYRTYLCVGDGERISPTVFSARLHHWNHDYFDCRWGVRDFRQCAITIGREFITPDDSYDQADNILAESADHSTGVDLSYYAVVQGAVPRLSNNSMCRHRWMGDQWHSILGLGPLPPPEPIRISRKNIANGTSLQSMLDMVRKTTKETLTSFLDAHASKILQHTVCSTSAQHSKDATANVTMREISSPLPSTWKDRSLRLSGHLDDLFYDESEVIHPDLPLSSGTSGYNENSSMNHSVAVSPTASGYIQCGNMLSDSPLPSSSITSISRTEYIEGSVTSSGIVPTSDKGELTPIYDRKGKGRAYEPGTQVALKDIPGSSPVFDDAMSSTISPVANVKRKRGTYKAREVRPTDVGISSTERHTSHFLQQHQSIPDMSSETPLPSNVYRTQKHAIQQKRPIEDQEEHSRRPKRIRRLSMEEIIISSDQDISSVEEIPSKRRHGQRPAMRKTPVEVVTISSSDSDSSPDENIPIK
ncbi:uncharacterized protein HD556DRAFT_1312140, partial [Suillus plorans]